MSTRLGPKRVFSRSAYPSESAPMSTGTGRNARPISSASKPSTRSR